MPRLTLMRGYPGSGKTTIARLWVADDPDNRVRVNRDDLRESVFCQVGVLSNDKEALITKTQREIATAALKAGKDVVNDDTNLRRKFAVEWATLAKSLGADFEVVDIKTPLEVCLEQNRLRDRVVPEDAIRSLAKKFPIDKWPTIEAKETALVVEPYERQESGYITFLVDIDGTVADFTKTNHRGPFDWAKVGGDDPRKDIIHVINSLAEHNDIVFLSGRDGVCRKETEQWLQEHVDLHGAPLELYMRAEGDNRPDYVVKYELFNAHARHRNIVGVFDDRPQVVRLWHELGLTVFNVGDGTEF